MVLAPPHQSERPTSVFASTRKPIRSANSFQVVLRLDRRAFYRRRCQRASCQEMYELYRYESSVDDRRRVVVIFFRVPKESRPRKMKNKSVVGTTLRFLLICTYPRKIMFSSTSPAHSTKNKAARKAAKEQFLAVSKATVDLLVTKFHADFPSSQPRFLDPTAATGEAHVESADGRFRRIISLFLQEINLTPTHARKLLVLEMMYNFIIDANTFSLLTCSPVLSGTILKKISEFRKNHEEADYKYHSDLPRLVDLETRIYAHHASLSEALGAIRNVVVVHREFPEARQVEIAQSASPPRSSSPLSSPRSSSPSVSHQKSD